MNSRLLIMLITAFAVLNTYANNDKISVTCTHDDRTIRNSIRDLIEYKHYNQERRNILAQYDTECNILNYDPAKVKNCLALIKAYEDIRNNIESERICLEQDWLLRCTKDEPRYKCHDVIGKRAESMAMWKK